MTHYSLRSLLSATALTLCIPGLLSAADYRVVQEVTTPGGKEELTISMSGQKVRMDTGEQMSIIFDPEAGNMTQVVHTEKMYMVLPKEMLTAMQAMQPKPDEKAPEPELKKTGKSEEINGFQTEEYTSTFKDPTQGEITVNYWLATNKNPGLDFMKQLTATQKALGFGEMSGPGEISPDKLPGFPVRVITKLENGEEVTMTVKSISTDKLDPTLLAVPSDYKKMEQPGMPPGGGAPPAETPATE